MLVAVSLPTAAVTATVMKPRMTMFSLEGIPDINDHTSKNTAKTQIRVEVTDYSTSIVWPPAASGSSFGSVTVSTPLV